MAGDFQHVMHVPSDFDRGWYCDIRLHGAYAGIRIATKLRPNNEIESQLEWIDREEDGTPMESKNHGLVLVLNGRSGTENVPRRVIEWLMTGEDGS